MKVLQVKRYHREVAQAKHHKAIIRWKQSFKYGYAYPIESMFYFMLEDNKGFPTTKRKIGYVAYDEHKSVFGKNEVEAIEKFCLWGI